MSDNAIIHLKDPRRGPDRWPAKRAVPRSTGFAELDAATANYERVQESFQAAAETHAQAERELEQAVLDDRAALALAHRTGARSKPKGEQVDKARASVATAEREMEALRLATGECVADVSRLLDEHSGVWAQEADEAADAKRETTAAALEPLLEALGELHHAEAVAGWLRAGGIFNPQRRPVAGVPFETLTLELRRLVGLAPPPVENLPDELARIRREGPPLGPDGTPSPTMTGAAA